MVIQQLSDPSHRKAVYDALREISNSMTRIEAERDLIKETINNIKDQYELPTKYTRKLAKIYHKQNFNEVKAEQEDIEALYETIAG
jgi:hypothetical protein